MRVVRITEQLRERVGGYSDSKAGVVLVSGRKLVQVVFRAWHHHYEILDVRSGQWLASFDDVSENGKAAFEEVNTAAGVRLVFAELRCAGKTKEGKNDGGKAE